MFDVQALRQQFPALQARGDGPAPVFLDGPGGTQVPQRVIDAITHYLTYCNANHGGLFATSQTSDAILQAAHQAVADFLNAPTAAEIVFGANMTTLTLQLARAFARSLRPGDEVLVTNLDHDANVTPWTLAARDAGATVRTCDVRLEDCTLDLDQLRRQLSANTRLLAVTCASNAVGSLTDVRTLSRWAHEVGALVYLDAVHYAPHGLIDVQAWDCDFLGCSAYKFFGPHVGILWGRRELLEALPAYKVRPAPETLPERWMTGTQNHEGIAGVKAALDYLADVAGSQATATYRQRLLAGKQAIRAYETELAHHLLIGLAARPRFQVFGITDLKRLAERVPTVSIRLAGRSAADIAAHLAASGIHVWNGNMYALNLSERLGLEQHGGFLRLGLVHYNTHAEIDRLLAALDEL